MFSLRKCDALEAKLAELRTSMDSSNSITAGEQLWTRKVWFSTSCGGRRSHCVPQSAPDAPDVLSGLSVNADVVPVAVDDVLKWAEDIGI